MTCANCIYNHNEVCYLFDDILPYEYTCFMKKTAKRCLDDARERNV